MSTNFETWFRTTLALPLSASDTTMTVATAPTRTTWRVFVKQWSIEEWISYTWVSSTTLTWLTRWLSKTADPATAWTGQSFIAWAEVKLVAMHDQIADTKSTNTFTLTQTFTDIDFTWTTTWGLKVKSLTTTQRNALTPSNWMIVYDSTLWEHYQYIAGAWSAISAWSTQPNGSTTVAWKVEIATDAEITAWTWTWWTGALLVPTPTQIKKSISLKNAWTTFGDTDEIVVNISWEDKRITWANLRDSIPASATQKWTVEMATDAEASTWTDETRYVNSKQIKLVTTWFTTVTSTSGDTSVFTATKPWYLNFYIWASHSDNMIWWVTSYIAYSTDWGSTYTTINTVTNNSSWWSWTASTVEWSGVWHYNIGMKIKGNVTVTSSWSWLVRFDYSN